MHEKNITNFFRDKKGMKVWYNEPSVKSAKHPTKLNPRYLKTFKSREEAEVEAKSISRSYKNAK
jgi:hypothetical protein